MDHWERERRQLLDDHDALSAVGNTLWKAAEAIAAMQQAVWDRSMRRGIATLEAMAATPELWPKADPELAKTACLRATTAVAEFRERHPDDPPHMSLQEIITRLDAARTTLVQLLAHEQPVRRPDETLASHDRRLCQWYLQQHPELELVRDISDRWHWARELLPYASTNSRQARPDTHQLTRRLADRFLEMALRSQHREHSPQKH
jgi:hypothetical protein